jgi:lysophospholipase L1-like esterase
MSLWFRSKKTAYLFKAMGNDLTKNIILAVSSVIAASVLLIGGYELYESHQYERWRSAYQRMIQQHDTLTIPSPNELLMWEYRPQAEFYDPEIKYKIRTNSHGFRDGEYELTSNEQHFVRVAFVGDSVTLGLKVSEENTFVRRFEKLARDAYPGWKIEAMNFGVDGYQVMQIYEISRTKVLQFLPDKVVYMMCLNDFDFEDASGEKILYFKKPGSFFLKKLEYLYKQLSQKEYHRYYFERNKQTAFHYLSKMHELLEREGIRFQVVLLPVFEESDDGFKNYPLKDLHQQIAKVLTEHKIEVVDLMDNFTKQDKAPKFYAYDIWHPNEAGHRFIAQQLLGPVLASY